LCKLHGVGVATASAIIAAVTDEYCYMGDEALAVSIPFYTLGLCLRKAGRDL
jgi:hypothetical protein